METKFELLKRKRFRLALIFFLISFILLTLLVVTGSTRAVEEDITTTIAEGSRGLLFDCMTYLTYMGDYPFLLPASLAVIFSLYRYNEKALSIFFGGLMASVIPAYKPLKMLIGRPRPELGLASAPGYGYPSGHTVSAFTFFMGLYVFYQVLYREENDVLIFSICAALASIVGISRLILGVHLPTDVLGGILLSGVLITSFSIGYKKGHKKLEHYLS
ncbi:MAG: phosphatase PAP2 family protein [Candidatus Thermoplasmatota archaeon]|nr:phosphatase PAP2 family protein [Candidatus Thermoplasmatota archaeon]